MSILSGWLKTRAYRKTADGYKKESRDTSSETVYMNDGNTAETNLGDIKGITDSLTATSSNVALSAKGGNSLQGQIDTLNSNLNHAIFYVITSENLDTVVNNQALSIGYGVIDKGEEGFIGYISFNIAWIAIQLLIRPDNVTFWRVKYGSNAWSEWTKL